MEKILEVAALDRVKSISMDSKKTPKEYRIPIPITLIRKPAPAITHP
jgi:hypothetical protein